MNNFIPNILIYLILIYVEQELLTLPEHPSSPRFIVRFVLLDLSDL